MKHSYKPISAETFKIRSYFIYKIKSKYIELSTEIFKIKIKSNNRKQNTSNKINTISCIPDKVSAVFSSADKSYLTYLYPTHGIDKNRI